MSGLKIYYSDRIEDLARELKKRLLDERKTKATPFEFSKVVVPNTNIAKWL
jgi:exonuclease V gamma subunit